MKHKHHIIPRHMNGTDDPSNIIELTIEEHAKAHKLLYEQYGKWQDWCAWQGLAGIIPKKELIRQIQSLANKGKPTSDYVRELRRINASKRIRTLEEKQKASESAKRNHTLGKYDNWHSKKSERMMGHIQPQSQKDKVAKALAKEWLFYNPNGELIHIVNLQKFCRENGLDQGNMHKVSQGILKKHKGWKSAKA